MTNAIVGKVNWSMRLEVGEGMTMKNLSPWRYPTLLLGDMEGAKRKDDPFFFCSVGGLGS